MLTADLLRARVRGPTIQPTRVDHEDEHVADLALRVHEAFHAAVETQARLGEVLAELEDVTQGGHAKLGKGIVRVAQDRCITEVESEFDPAALRMEVFLKAAEQRPLSMSEVLPGCRTAAHVLEEVGKAHGVSGVKLAEQLYADLPSERRVESFEVPSPKWLVDRYNVALVQGLLVGATEVRVKLDKPTTPRMRQLVRWIKFEQLLCRILPHGEGFEIVLDGPVSLFGPSTRYGLNLARVFPAILLQEPPWQLEATVLWTRARLRKQLVIKSTDGYVSHYSDTGAYRSRAVEHLMGRFAEPVRGWHLSGDVISVQLGKEVLFPDFSLLHPEGELVHVEVLGFWRASSLEQRLAALDKSPEIKLIFAVSRKLKGGEEAIPEDPRVVPYTDAISPQKLVEAAEICISRAL